MENISQMSLLEVALKIMEEKGGVVNIYDLINEVLALKGLEDPDNALATQLYVDITTSSKFVYMGEDNWDLKSRQSLDQFDKDGASFNPKDGSFEEDEEDETDEDDLDEDDESDEDDEDDESDEDDEDEDEKDESEEDEESEEEEYFEDEESYEDEEETDEDDSIDEEKYNEYMDDYEDLYES